MSQDAAKQVTDWSLVLCHCGSGRERGAWKLYCAACQPRRKPKETTTTCQEVFRIGDEVFHRDYGDGEILGSYGAHKISVRFGAFGVKRVPVESVSADPAICNHGMADLLRECEVTDEDIAEAEEMLAELHRTQTRGPATVIPFPANRIVRRISHGRVVVVSSAKLAELAADANITVPFPRRPA
jgi:hypothetical protein